jgi:hypothetical protein
MARIWRAVGGLSLFLVALLAGCRAEGLRRSDVVPDSDVKKPTPRLLSDGTPVLVVAKPGYPPVGVEAIDTWARGGVAALVRWCPESDTYVSTYYARYDK